MKPAVKSALLSDGQMNPMRNLHGKNGQVDKSSLAYSVAKHADDER
jgi:hypothetical protein